MDAKHEILLEQILGELRVQTRALQDLQRRMDGLERILSHPRDERKAANEGEARP